MRRAAFVTDTALALGAALAPAPSPRRLRRRPPRSCLAPPVVAPVSRPFYAPPCPWCAGHRGVTLRGRAPAPSCGRWRREVVTFSGVVVDVRYVVVRHGDGLLATYGGLASSPLGGW